MIGGTGELFGVRLQRADPLELRNDLLSAFPIVGVDVGRQILESVARLDAMAQVGLMGDLRKPLYKVGSRHEEDARPQQTTAAPASPRSIASTRPGTDAGSKPALDPPRRRRSLSCREALRTARLLSLLFSGRG